jgi:hypothetical protein
VQLDPPLGVSGYGRVVRYKDNRHAALMQVAKRGQDLGAGTAIQIARWLIGEQQSRLVNQRSRDRDALLLPPGELRGMVVGAICQPDLGQDGKGSLFTFFSPNTGIYQGQRDVLERSCAREQIVRLENEASCLASISSTGSPTSR